MNPPRHLLCFASGSIGDALMMLALCEEVAICNPGVSSEIFTRKNFSLVSDLALAAPSVRVHELRARPRHLLTLARSFFRTWSVIIPWRFGKNLLWNSDVLSFIFSCNPKSLILSFFPHRVARSSRLVGVNTFNHFEIYIENLRRLAQRAGYHTHELNAPVTMSFRPSLSKEHLVPPKPYIVFHPFGSNSWKSWPPARCRSVLLALAKQYPLFSFVITGGSENAKQGREIIADIPRTTLAAGLPILDVASIIQHSALFIGVDTGTTHLASVVNHKVIALEHNANPEWLPTYNPNGVILTNKEHCICGGVKNESCKVVVDGSPYMRCLYEISDETIVEAVVSSLAIAKDAS